MATIKAYTDISQSKVLATILPLESADMCYRYYSGGIITGYGDCVLAKSFITEKNVIRENDLPCWSLAALLSVLPIVNLCAPTLKIKLNHKYYMELCIDSVNYKYISTKDYNNPVDACVAMVEKLNELNLL